MEYEDRWTIATPEGIELSFTLAGAASRFVAALVDLAIQSVLLIVLAVIAALVGGGGVAVAVSAILGFLVIFGYDVLFEVLNSGRTPGKQLNGLRVVRVGGHPVGFITSAMRNMIRVIDFLPGAYLLGATVILATKKNQRLGDIVAGTLVVRQRASRLAPLPEVAPAASAGGPTAAWDTSLISAEELSTVTQFLGRRSSIDHGARVELASKLSARLRPKITGVPADLHGEPFLEALVASRQRLRR